MKLLVFSFLLFSFSPVLVIEVVLKFTFVQPRLWVLVKRQRVIWLLFWP